MASKETVLVVGATGNIGSSAIIAAHKTGRNVLAVVRNQDSAEKMFKHLGFRDGVTTVEGDVLDENTVQNVVDKVKAGDLPAFQHVYSTVGFWNPTTPTHTIPTDEFRKVSQINIESNFFAYRATIPYLLSHGGPNATFTLMTGAAGEYGAGGVTAITQGALFSLATCASRELANTNVRFNEVYLAFRVDFDSVAEEKGNRGTIGSSVFAQHYVNVLERTDVKGARFLLTKHEDLKDVKFTPKLGA